MNVILVILFAHQIQLWIVLSVYQMLQFALYAKIIKNYKIMFVWIIVLMDIVQLVLISALNNFLLRFVLFAVMMDLHA